MVANEEQNKSDNPCSRCKPQFSVGSLNIPTLGIQLWRFPPLGCKFPKIYKEYSQTML